MPGLVRNSVSHAPSADRNSLNSSNITGSMAPNPGIRSRAPNRNPSMAHNPGSHSRVPNSNPSMAPNPGSRSRVRSRDNIPRASVAKNPTLA